MQPGDAWVAAHQREHERSEKGHRREHQGEEKARGLALSDMSRRLDELNNLRAEVVTDRNAFLTRSEYNAKHDALISRIDALEKVVDHAEGSIQTWRFLVTFVGIGGMVALALAIMNTFRLGT